jgi:hypothetical protein
MQAIKDAGIVLVVILLLVSVRFSPSDVSDEAQGLASLTPQTEAAPAPLPVEQALPATVANAPQKFQFQWVQNEGEELSLPDGLESAAVERCTELLFHIRKAAEQTHNETIVIQAEEVAKVLPCSA